MIAKFFSEQTRDDHLGESEESDLFLNAPTTQNAPTDQFVGKVNLVSFIAKQPDLNLDTVYKIPTMGYILPLCDMFRRVFSFSDTARFHPDFLE